MSRSEKILLLLYGSFLVDMMFNLVPDGGQKYDFFPFFDGYTGWDGKMTVQTYVHKFCGHVARLMIIGAFVIESSRPEVRTIFWISFVDLIDFCLCYSYRWFYMLGYSVEYNDITFVLITILILQSLWKQHKPSF